MTELLRAYEEPGIDIGQRNAADQVVRYHAYVPVTNRPNETKCGWSEVSFWSPRRWDDVVEDERSVACEKCQEILAGEGLGAAPGS